MKKRTLKWLVPMIWIIMTGVVMYPQNNIDAAISDSDANWEAKPITDQENKNVGYWDLKYQPGKQLQLKLMLRNLSSKDKTLLVTVKNAVTNQRFATDYNPNSNLSDGRKSLVNLAEISRIDGRDNNVKEVFVRANTEKQVPVELSLPKHKIVGDVLGGLTVVENSQNENRTSSLFPEGYSFAILLHGKPESEKVKQVAITKVFYKDNKILMRIRNYSQSVIRNINVTGRLSDNKRHKIPVKLEDKLLVPRAHVDVVLSEDPQIRQLSANTKANIQVTGDTFYKSYAVDVDKLK